MSHAVAAVVVVGLQVVGGADAQPSSAGSRPAPAQRGTLLRGCLGPAYFLPGGAAGDQFDVTGPATSFGLLVGRAVVPNVVLHGQLLGAVAIAPAFSNLDGTLPSGGDAAARVFGIGVGASFYIMPANVYLAGTLSLSQVTLVNAGVVLDAGVAHGIAIAGGKEWWVSERVGLGVAVQLAGVAGAVNGVRGGGSERSYRAQTIGAMVSVSYDVATD